MNGYSFQDIVPYIDGDFKITGNVEGKFFNNLKPPLEAEVDSLIFVDSGREDKLELIMQTQAQIIICDLTVDMPNNKLGTKSLIQVENPRLVFVKLGNALFVKRPQSGIHVSAFVHPEAEIHKTAYIGPFSYVGKSRIGAGTIIHGHVYIYDDVTIGENVIIHSGCVIGADGFGYMRLQDGSIDNFPHLGGVLIENEVEIGANTCVDRGSLGNTIIRQGAKIDNLVHIAHNVHVGKFAMVIAHAMIGGSVNIGDYAWVSPSCAVRDQINIGDRALVGLGAVVTKSIPDGETWVGSPARLLDEFLQREKNFKKLIGN